MYQLLLHWPIQSWYWSVCFFANYYEHDGRELYFFPIFPWSSSLSSFMLIVYCSWSDLSHLKRYIPVQVCEFRSLVKPSSCDVLMIEQIQPGSYCSNPKSELLKNRQLWKRNSLIFLQNIQVYPHSLLSNNMTYSTVHCMYMAAKWSVK